VLEHLKAIERQTGVTPQALLNAPRLPTGCEELWSVFCDIHNRRGEGPLSYVEIDAYQRVANRKIAPWELEAIQKADDAYLAQVAARTPKQ